MSEKDMSDSFEWNSGKYLVKWGEIWQKWTDANYGNGNYQKSGFWMIDNQTIQFSSYYDSICRHNYISGNETIVFPAMVDCWPAKEHFKSKFIFGIEWEETAFNDDELHKKAINQALKCLQDYVEKKNGELHFHIEPTVLNDSAFSTINIKHLGGNSQESTLKDYVSTLHNKNLVIRNTKGEFQHWFLQSLLPLSVIQWPLRSKYLLKNFPFDFVCTEIENIDKILMTSLVVGLIMKNYMISEDLILPFKEIFIVMEENDRVSTFEDVKFSNKLLNLSKFIAQLKKTISNAPKETKVSTTNIKKATPITRKTDVDAKTYEREFLMSLQENYLTPPKDLPTITINKLQRVIVSKWHSQHRQKVSGANMDEEKIRKIRGFFSKITDKTFESIVPKMIPLLHEDIVPDVVQLLFDVVSMDKHFHFIYARICLDFQGKCNEFVSKFMDKCKSHIPTLLDTSNEHPMEQRREISVMLFLAFLLKEKVITPQHVCFWIDEWLKNTDNLGIREIELLCAIYQKWEGVYYGVAEMKTFLKNHYDNKANAARMRFLCLDVLEILQKNKPTQKILSLGHFDSKIQKKTTTTPKVNMEDSDTGDTPTYIQFLNSWIKKTIILAEEKVRKAMQVNDLKQASYIIVRYFFDDFSDIYLESVKPYLFQQTYRAFRSVIFETVIDLYFTSLVMVYPFYPVVVEEICQRYDIFAQRKSTFLENNFNATLILENDAILADEDYVEFQNVRQIIDCLKRKRKNLNISKHKPWSIYILCKNDAIYDSCVKYYDFIQVLTICKDLSIEKTEKSRSIPENYKQLLNPTFEGKIDVTLFFYHYISNRSRNTGNQKKGGDRYSSLKPKDNRGRGGEGASRSSSGGGRGGGGRGGGGRGGGGRGRGGGRRSHRDRNK